MVRLLLTSNSLCTDDIATSFRDLNDAHFGRQRCLNVTTAAMCEPGDKDWLRQDIDSYRQFGFAGFEAVDIGAIGADRAVNLIEMSDVIVVGGGDPFHLARVFNALPCPSPWPSWLDQKLYVGISAGSIVTAPNLGVRAALEQLPATAAEPGLGLVDFHFIPHVGEAGYPANTIEHLRTIAVQLGVVVRGCSDSAALVVSGSEVTQIDTGCWCSATPRD
jgi:dipeptidase E